MRALYDIGTFSDDTDQGKSYGPAPPHAICEKDIDDFITVPLSTISIYSNSILILDTYSTIIVWVGNNAMKTPGIRNILVPKILQQLHSNNKRRFPYPHIKCLYEGSRAARSLHCWLEPGHRDTYEQQVKELSQVSPSLPIQLEYFRNSFHTDDVTFNQWYLSFK